MWAFQNATAAIRFIVLTLTFDAVFGMRKRTLNPADKAERAKAAAQSSDCQQRLMELGVASAERIGIFTGQCGIDHSDIEQGSGPQGLFSVTLDGKSRICSPTCRGDTGLETAITQKPLPDIEQIRRDCIDARSVEEIQGPAAMTLSLAAALTRAWQSCSTTALRDSDCDCDFTWNSFQHTYAVMVGTGRTTPSERAAMYHRYKRECGCEAIKANKAGINVKNITVREDAGPRDSNASTIERDTLQAMILLEHMHTAIMDPTCEAVKSLFAQWDVHETGQLEQAQIATNFAALEAYQSKHIKDEQSLAGARTRTQFVLEGMGTADTGTVSLKTFGLFILGSDGVRECGY